MPPGRPAKPTALHAIDGTGRPGRQNPDEPAPDVVALPCPSHVSGIARKEWLRIVPELVALGLLTKVDAVALEGYCMAYQRWREAEEILAEEGLTMASPQGMEMQRPEISISHQSRKQCLEFLREFGLTPASRGKVRATPRTGKEDTLEKLKRRKAEMDAWRRNAKT